MSIKHIFRPELFQGYRKKDHYFEGWYFKLVSKDEKYSIAFIPGVSINKKDPHLFIQVFFIKNNLKPTLNTFYIRYPYQKNFYHKDQFEVKIGQSLFSNDKVKIDIKDQIHIEGEISIINKTPIKKSLITPNIMGFFGYFGFMECYHGVISMNHHLMGNLLIDGIQYSFDHGKGYIEKDWGKSFPRAYVWVQSNHFKEENVSLMFSYADIPFLGFYFKGLISILHIHGMEYRFATYNFTKVKHEEISPNRVFYTLKKRNLTLQMTAFKKESVDLISPKNGMMNQTIKEGLSGEVEVKLYKRKMLIYEGKGSSAGIEIMKK